MKYSRIVSPRMCDALLLTGYFILKIGHTLSHRAERRAALGLCWNTEVTEPEQPQATSETAATSVDGRIAAVAWRISPQWNRQVTLWLNWTCNTCRPIHLTDLKRNIYFFNWLHPQCKNGISFYESLAMLLGWGYEGSKNTFNAGLSAACQVLLIQFHAY